MKAISKKLSNFIRDQDEIVDPGAHQLHFNTDFKQKTIAGGFASILVSLYVVYMVYSNGRKMMTKDNNSYKSLEEQMNYEEVGKVYLDQTAKPLYEILENGDNTIDLGADKSD
jgi:hypothetical protein